MIAYDSSSSGSTVNPGTSLSWLHTCSGTQRLLLVALRGGNSEGDKVTGVTYNGVAMTKITSVTSPSTGNITISLWYLLNPSSGSNTVTASLSSGFLGGGSISYTGVRQVGFPDNSTTNTGHTVSSLNTSLTTVRNNCWTLLYGMADSISASTGSTLRTTVSRGALFDSNGVVTPAGAKSMAFTNSVDDVASIMVSFAPHINNAGFLFN